MEKRHLILVSFRNKSGGKLTLTNSDLVNLLSDKEVRKQRQKERGMKISFTGASQSGRKSELIEKFQSKPGK